MRQCSFNTGDANVEVSKLTPRIGTEIKGLQLSQLTTEQRNELALLIAERGVVVFRGQDFKDIGPEKQKEFGEYFGKLHVHVCPPSQSFLENKLTIASNSLPGPM